MPIIWNISHAARLVTMKADGPINLQDAEAYLDDLVVNDAMPYAKLVDCTTMEVNATDHDMMMLGARMRAYVATLEGGPLAFVVATLEARNYVLRYINLAGGATRPVKMFDNEDDARRWLEAQRS